MEEQQVDMLDHNGIDCAGDEVEHMEVEVLAEPVKTKKSKKSKRKVKEATAAQELEAEAAPHDNGDLNGNGVTEEHEQAADEPTTIEPPKSKRTRLPNFPSKKKDRYGGYRYDTTARQKTVDRPETNNADDDDDVANLLNSTRVSKNAAKIPNSQKSRRQIVEETAPDPDQVDDVQQLEDPQDQSTLDRLLQIPQKLKRGKRKSKEFSKRSSLASLVTGQEDNYDSDAALHRPLTPAFTSHQHNQGSQEDVPMEVDARVQHDIAFQEPAEDDMEPRQPSKKALGKRKASDQDPLSKKKQKQILENGTPNGDIRSFGSMAPLQAVSIPRSLQSNGTEMGGSTNMPLGTSRATPQFTPINQIGVPAASSAEEPQGPESSAPTSSAKRRKRRLPTGEADAPEVPVKKTPRKFKSANPMTPKTEPKTPRKRATPATKGKLSSDEISEIEAAVERYRDQHDLEQRAMNDLIQADAQSSGREFWKFMYEEVDNIPSKNIMNICRRKFHNFERGAWTQENDNELREAYERNPGKWKIIGNTINRFPEDCRDRYRNYVLCGDKMRKDVWDREEEDRLKEVVQECIQAVRDSEYNSGAPVGSFVELESKIDWTTVSRKMDLTRSRLQCATKWKRLKERQESEVEDLAPVSETAWRIAKAEEKAYYLGPQDKLKILYAVRDSGAGREGKIPWISINERLNMKGKRMVLKVCFRKLRENIPGHEGMKLQDIVAELIAAFEAAAPEEPEGFDASFSPRRKKRKKKRVMPGDGVPGENGEGPSTQRKKSTQQLSNEYVVDDDDEQPEGNGENVETPVPSKRKRKAVRDRMKAANESQSQHTPEEAQRQPEEGGLEEVVQALKTRAKKPIVNVKTSKKRKALSETKVVEDDEDHEAPTNGHSHQEEEAPVNEDLPQVDDDEMDLDDAEDYTAAGGPGADSAVDEDEDYPESQRDESYYRDEDEDSVEHQYGEDYDQDEERIITNGFHSRESPDLDTPQKSNHRRTRDRTESPASDSDRLNRYDRSVSVSSSDSGSSIPAVARRKGSEELRNRQPSLEL